MAGWTDGGMEGQKDGKLNPRESCYTPILLFTLKVSKGKLRETEKNREGNP